MPLPLSNLDNLPWAALVDEGRALIPRYASRWNNHNFSDPGSTLIELFAWLAENTIYRLNRVPERHRRKFLALIGFTPQPPRAAQTVLTFTPDAGTGAFTLPEGTEFEAMDAEGQIVGFRTMRELTVSVVTLDFGQVDAGDGVIIDRTRDWRDVLPVAVFGEDPRANAALYLGFDSLPSGEPVAIAFRFQGPGADAAERARIIQEAAAQRAACRRILPDITCEDATGQPTQPEETLPPHHSAQSVWEVFTGGSPTPWTQLEPVTNAARPAVGQVWDDTRSLTLDGIVEVNLPAMARTTLKPGEPALFYLRCRLATGA